MAIGDVNRAKLYYLREKVGKKARVRELRQAVAPRRACPRAAEADATLDGRGRGRGAELAAEARAPARRRRGRSDGVIAERARARRRRRRRARWPRRGRRLRRSADDAVRG